METVHRVHVTSNVNQDKDSVWCVSARLSRGVGVLGDGATEEAAIADLRPALQVLPAETGPRPELNLASRAAAARGVRTGLV